MTRTVDARFIRESIHSPATFVLDGYVPAMPVIVVSDKEIDAVVAFIESRQ